ncbi:GD17790 [Drosophila simulans]|uniref:GD17790 n=1 Tax=Drosophila simulans TaxID=7240 RepID=B4R1H3_DROSI|nr:GD17790 [Drosophila simulans]
MLNYRLESCDCWFDDVLGSDNSTALLWNDQTYPHYLRHRQDTDILAVSCLRFHQYQEVLLALSLMLDQMPWLARGIATLWGRRFNRKSLNSARLLMRT